MPYTGYAFGYHAVGPQDHTYSSGPSVGGAKHPWELDDIPEICVVFICGQVLLWSVCHHLQSPDTCWHSISHGNIMLLGLVNYGMEYKIKNNI